MSRCHGPSCENEAVTDFCGFGCQLAWNAQFADPEPEDSPCSHPLEMQVPTSLGIILCALCGSSGDEERGGDDSGLVQT